MPECFPFSRMLSFFAYFPTSSIYREGSAHTLTNLPLFLGNVCFLFFSAPSALCLAKHGLVSSLFLCSSHKNVLKRTTLNNKGKRERSKFSFFSLPEQHFASQNTVWFHGKNSEWFFFFLLFSLFLPSAHKNVLKLTTLNEQEKERECSNNLKH